MIIKITKLVTLCLGLCCSCSTSKILLDAPARQKCFQVLREGLKSDAFWPSMHAAEALTLAGNSKEVRRLLETKLQAETDDRRRCGLARELVRAGDMAKSAVMLNILKGNNSYGHVHAAESLYKVGWNGNDAPLRAAFEQKKNDILRLMAAGALAKHSEDAKAMAFLREHMRTSTDPAQFRITAWLLGRIGGAKDAALIKARLKDTPNALTRAYLEHALAALGDADGQAALVSNLESEDPGSKVYAAVFAGDARMTSVKRQLTSLLNSNHLDTRIRAAQSLLVLAH
ncbi:MAG: hypothetical protein CMO64_03865 [Verrucomicrobiales bacterium]|nr:hypothetical protein [Verrucomicrobiales bacterium]